MTSGLRITLGELFGWWLRELRETAEDLLARLAPRWVTRTLVILTREGGSVSLVRGAHRECVLTFSNDAAGSWPDELDFTGPAAAVRGTRAVFALSSEDVLTRRLTLPESVERELDQVVGLQLERESPMPLDRVRIDRQISERLRRERLIKVDVSLVHRARVERVRELARKWGVHLVRVGVSTESGDVTGDFLRAPTRLSRLKLTSTDRRLTVSVASLAVVCLGVVAFHWTYERLELGRELERLQAPATTAKGLAKKLETDAAPAEALVNLMTQPDALDALTTLTTEVPKDSWVYDLEVSAQWPQTPRIKLSGFTPAATMLVGLLGAGRRFDDVRLVSAISAGLGSAQDRLQLTARLVTSGPVPTAPPAANGATQGGAR